MNILMRPTLLRMAAVMLCCGAVGVQAQTLRQLYDAAHGYDAALQRAQARARASLAQADQSQAGLLPQLALQTGAQRNRLDMRMTGVSSGSGGHYNVWDSALIGSQPLYRPANRIAWDQGKKQAELAQTQLGAAEQDLIVRLSQACFDVLAAEDALRFVLALKEAVAKQLEAAQRNFDLGNATITDSHEAQARFDLARAQEITAQNDLHVKRLALDQLVGQNGSQPRPLALPVTLPAPQPDNAEAWVNLAIDQHPALAQARMALDIARLETDKAKAAHLPTVDMQVSVSQSRYPDGNPALIGMTPGSRYRTTSASVGVVLNWPLFAGFALENRVRETLALQDQARADLDDIERTVSQATRAAFFGVQSGLSQVQALEAAEQSSLTALQANQLGYQVGVRINIDVLNAQSQLYQTQRDLSQARYDALLGLLRLKQSAGVLTPNDLLPIDQLMK
ncbi:MAG: TolC family outer membrane protein [Burkholderiaceae bacterium]|jgi:outer membrane protein|nr:TolC family outer membrane protein [Burkholderiaceae bacterium]